MSFLFKHPRTRRTAAVILFVWGLTLFSTLVNACVMHGDTGPVGHSGQADAVYVGELTALAQEDRAAPERQHGAHGGGLSPEVLACHGLSELQLAGPVAAPSHEPELRSVVALRTTPAPVAASSSDHEAQQRSVGDLSRSQPPVFIRFLRLTI